MFGLELFAEFCRANPESDAAELESRMGFEVGEVKRVGEAMTRVKEENLEELANSMAIQLEGGSLLLPDDVVIGPTVDLDSAMRAAFTAFGIATLYLIFLSRIYGRDGEVITLSQAFGESSIKISMPLLVASHS